MKTSELRKLIREEVRKVLSEAKPQGIDLWAKGSDYNQIKRTIGDILADGRRPDIPTYTWTSIRTLKSRVWGEIGKAQVSRFEPLIKKMQKYENMTVGEFFGKAAFRKLRELEGVFNSSHGYDREDFLKAFDDAYKIVTQALASKR
jgi:hypothetical protein